MLKDAYYYYYYYYCIIIIIILLTVCHVHFLNVRYYNMCLFLRLVHYGENVPCQHVTPLIDAR